MSANSFNILQTASILASRAHKGQSVRNTEIPYISHAIDVSMAVSCLFGCRDPEVAAAALLHDTLEKTGLTADEIECVLGPRVLQMVEALTKEQGEGKHYWQRLFRSGWEAKLIKMADVLDHLDCPPEELPRRIKNGRRALGLADSDEEPIRRAVRILEEAIAAAAARLGSLA